VTEELTDERCCVSATDEGLDRTRPWDLASSLRSVVVRKNGLESFGITGNRSGQRDTPACASTVVRREFATILYRFRIRMT
jgi:hypothetical protein